jgi:two-component system nitrate/nitrite response regulator NarL
MVEVLPLIRLLVEHAPSSCQEGSRLMAEATPPQPISVLIIDDHAVVRFGLGALIARHTEFKLVGEAETAKEALAITARQKPDCILLDLDLGDSSGLDLIPQLLSLSANSRVIVLTASLDQEAYIQAARLGAVGLVHKSKAVEVIVRAIKKVHEGEIWFDRATLLDMLTSGPAPTKNKKQAAMAAPVARLTEREYEIVSLVCEGLKNKQIASRLFITEATVAHHLTSIFSKLRVTDRLELVVYAFTYRLVKPPLSMVRAG